MKPLFKSLIPALVVCATALLWRAPAAAQEEEKVLNIYNWSDYIADDTIKNFEKETGIKVVVANFDAGFFLKILDRVFGDVVRPVVNVQDFLDRKSVV